MTGKGITDSIISACNIVGLSLHNLRGQGYDGCAAMKGHLNGVQTRISEIYPKALYTHCASHSLNLALSDSCSIQPITNCFGTVKEVLAFFSRSAKRVAALQNTIDHPELSGIYKSKLISLCETRWVERHDSILQFTEMLLPIVTTLEIIEDSSDGESSSKSYILQTAMKETGFLVSLFIAESILAITLPLSKALQETEIDLSTCYDMVQNTMDLPCEKIQTKNSL